MKLLGFCALCSSSNTWASARTRGDFGQLGWLKVHGSQANPALGAEDGLTQDKYSSQQGHRAQIDQSSPAFPGSIIDGYNDNGNGQSNAEGHNLAANIVQGLMPAVTSWV